MACYDAYSAFVYKQRKKLRNIIYVALVVLYSAYFGYCLYFAYNDNRVLMGLTIIFALVLLIKIFVKTFEKPVDNFIKRITHDITAFSIKFWKPILVVKLGLMLGILLYACIDVRNDPSRMISICGILFIFFVSCLMSGRNITQVPWGIVLNCINLQLVIALIVLRWRPGYIALQTVGNQMAAFLAYSRVGTRFVFGPKERLHNFAFNAVPTVVFFGAVSQILTYYGILEGIVLVIGTILQIFTGTNKIESFVAAANIFLGSGQVGMAVKQFLALMTMSELHALLCVGFASMSGSVMAIFVTFGVSASQMITASFMSAPAALAISKIICPETEKSKLAGSKIKFDKNNEANVIEAASNGAQTGMLIVGNVLANMIGFLSLISFFNGTMTWLGARVGSTEPITFQRICSYVFLPLAFLLGVEWKDCATVAEGIGTNIFANNALAFRALGRLIRNRQQGKFPQISERSEVIATYSFCNFAGVGAMAMAIAGVAALAPSRKGDVAKNALTGLITGNMASWVTACIAGLLYIPQDQSVPPIMNMTTASP